MFHVKHFYKIMGWYNAYSRVKRNNNLVLPYKIKDGADIDTEATVVFHGDGLEFISKIGGVEGAYAFPAGTFESLQNDGFYDIPTAGGNLIYMGKRNTTIQTIGYKIGNNARQELWSTSSWSEYRSNASFYVNFFYTTVDKEALRALIICSNSSGFSAWRGNVSGMTKSLCDSITSGLNIDADPYITAPSSVPDGGFGDYNYGGDDIPFPTLPSWSIVDSGFVTLYKPSIAQVKSLAQYLWTGVFDLTTYKKIFADPMDCIISLSRVPIDAPATGSHVLSVGNISTGLSFDVLSSQFVEVNFVSKNIGLRANGFLDYAPYVKVQIYLPFIGMRALSIDDIAGKDISLKYQVDLFTGACTAYLKCSITNSDGNNVDSVLYQYSGNVLANIPITQANYDSFISSVITAAAKTGSALISGGAAAAAGAALSSGINVAANIKPDVERSGNMTATSGFLGIKKPYLIVTYPNICKPRNREKTVSIPSFIGLGIQPDNSNLKLSDFKGLTILHKINVKNIPCTEIERQMIESQLTTEGVIL